MNLRAAKLPVLPLVICPLALGLSLLTIHSSLTPALPL